MRKFLKKAEGFTLVELVVVIAILGILAGVGTVGYSGYVKSAQKKADQTLVSNIVRAIEVGTNSTMFVNKDSYAFGASTYPVGLIVLSADAEDGTSGECQVMASGTGTHIETTDCAIVNANGAQEQRFVNSYTYECKENSVLGVVTSTVDVYTNVTYSYPEYCSVHTKLPSKRTGYPSAKKSWGSWKGDGTKIEEYFLEDCSGMFELKDRDSGHVVNGSITTEELNQINGTRVNATTSGALYDSIVAAFGPTANLKLQYNGWGSAEDDGEGHTYATLMNYTDTMLGNIKEMSDTLLGAASIPVVGEIAKEYLSEDFTDSADVVDSYANFIVDNYQTEDQWMAQWNAAPNGHATGYVFGIDQSAHHDYAYASAKAYNCALASYYETNDIDSAYVGATENFTTEAGGGALDVPRTVTKKTFVTVNDANKADSETLLYQFIAAGNEAGYDEATSIAAYEKCKAMYDTYVTSGVCDKNGRVFYSTCQTLKQTGTNAYTSGAAGDGKSASENYFAYYENYMAEMGAFYQAVENVDESSIAIIVTVVDGEVVCEVTPSSANLRAE